MGPGCVSVMWFRVCLSDVGVVCLVRLAHMGGACVCTHELRDCWASVQIIDESNFSVNAGHIAQGCGMLAKLVRVLLASSLQSTEPGSRSGHRISAPVLWELWGRVSSRSTPITTLIRVWDRPILGSKP